MKHPTRNVPAGANGVYRGHLYSCACMSKSSMWASQSQEQAAYRGGEQRRNLHAPICFGQQPSRWTLERLPEQKAAASLCDRTRASASQHSDA